MPFEVLADTSVPRVIAEGTGYDGEDFVSTENTSYATGAILEDDEVAPSVRKRLEDGDPYTGRLLRHISDEEAAEKRREQRGGNALQEVSVRDETPTDPNPHVPDAPVTVETVQAGESQVVEATEPESPVTEAPAPETPVEEAPASEAEVAQTTEEAQEVTDEQVAEETKTEETPVTEEVKEEAPKKPAPKKNKFTGKKKSSKKTAKKK